MDYKLVACCQLQRLIRLMPADLIWGFAAL